MRGDIRSGDLGPFGPPIRRWTMDPEVVDMVSTAVIDDFLAPHHLAFVGV